MKKLGQAALEFLSTYGFAFLIILVMIGALSYFGVLNPGNLLPDRCTLPPEFGCQDFRIATGLTGPDAGDANLSLIMTNNAGTVISLSQLNVTTQFLNSQSQLCNVVQRSVAGNSLTNVPAGGTIYYECKLDGQFPTPGEKVRITLEGEYKPTSSRFNKTFTGDVYADAVQN